MSIALGVVAAASGSGGVEVVYADESIWLTQKMMGVLYDVETHTINYHLKKVFSDSELQANAVIRNFRITAADGKNYNTKHYKLPAIIAVGYKVNSERAVQFRKWATTIIEEYTITARSSKSPPREGIRDYINWTDKVGERRPDGDFGPGRDAVLQKQYVEGDRLFQYLLAGSTGQRGDFLADFSVVDVHLTHWPPPRAGGPSGCASGPALPKVLESE